MTDILLSGSSKKCFYNYSILPLVICLSLVLKAQGGHSLSLQHHGDGLNPAQADEESFPVPVSASSGLYKFGGSNPSHGGGVGAGQQWRPNVQYFMKLFRKSPSLKVILEPQYISIIYYYVSLKSDKQYIKKIAKFQEIQLGILLLLRSINSIYLYINDSFFLMCH